MPVDVTEQFGEPYRRQRLEDGGPKLQRDPDAGKALLPGQIGERLNRIIFRKKLRSNRHENGAAGQTEAQVKQASEACIASKGGGQGGHICLNLTM